MNMPILNGLESTKILRGMQKANKINLDSSKILLHSAIQETIESQGLFDGVLSKPINFKQLE